MSGRSETSIVSVRSGVSLKSINSIRSQRFVKLKKVNVVAIQQKNKDKDEIIDDLRK
jgi:hypothetical protein